MLVLPAPAGDARAAPIPWPQSSGGNGHYYELVSPEGGITWTDAKVEAESLLHLATPGHLVTLGDQAEWDFVRSTFPQAYTWIGLTDEADEGRFQWVTGEPLGFSAWKPNEPNNAGDEDYVHYDSGGWNDFHNRKTVYSEDFPHHYVVEYAVPEPGGLVLLSLAAVGFVLPGVLRAQG